MMIDMHSHILPGVDDGAESYQDSIRMLAIAAEDGITDIIATPHYIHHEINNTYSLIKNKCDQLFQAVKENSINIRIYPGSEIFICMEMVRLIKEGQVATLNHSEYVLLELPMKYIPAYAYDVIYRLKLEGYTPIIAHPERYDYIIHDASILYNMIKRGALAQMNAGSLTGMYGKNIKQTAWRLLRHGLIHFISTDAHSCHGRIPRLNHCRRIVEEEMGSHWAYVLFQSNAKAVINNEGIFIPEPEEVKEKKIFFVPWFKHWQNHK